jgi:hypothetical protein
MGRWSGIAVRLGRLPLVTVAALALAVAAALGTSAAPPQVAAPYELFARTDCELKSEYSAKTKTTTVQLALTPPGPDNSPSGASLILQAQYAGTEPIAPPEGITILALPAITSNPNIIRGVELEFTIERAGGAPVRLFYFGKAWGEYEFVPPGGEIRRVAFNLSVAEVKALLLSERVTGRVMNYSFVLTDKHLAALRLFASAIGVSGPAGTSPKR